MYKGIYNYLEEVKNDVEMWILENPECREIEDLNEYLNDVLFTEDGITGNASGSYTFSRSQAKEYVIENLDLLKEACECFCVEPESIGEKFLEEDFEYFDVTIRCYILNQAISEVLEGMEYFF